jgi:hypothetical protein
VGSLAQAQGYYSYPGLQYEKGIVSGVYTPTLGNVSNLDSSSPYESNWWRFGPLVFVYGMAEIDATSTASEVQLQISLPLPSTLDSSRDLKGFVVEHLIPSGTGTVIGDASLTKAVAVWKPATNGARDVVFQFTYLIKGQ